MKHLYTCIAILYCFTATAQLNPGINTSSWGGVSNTLWNPSIAGGRYIVDVSLGTMNTGMYQNHVGIKPLNMFNNTAFNEAFGLGVLSNEILNSDLKKVLDNSSQKNINQWAVIEGPGSFMLPFGNDNNAIAVSYHLNSARSIRNMDPALATWNSGRYSLIPTTGIGAVNITQATWLDYALTYSRVAYNKGPHFFKVGATFKILHTLDAAIFNSQNFSYTLNNTDLTVNSANVEVRSATGAGISAGADFGFVYELRLNKDKYKYEMDGKTDLFPKFRDIHTLAIGFSVMDIGALRLNKSGLDGVFNLTNFNTNATNFNLYDTRTAGNVVANAGTNGGSNSSNIWLPMRINMFADYHIVKGLGLNLNASVAPYITQTGSQLTYGSYISLVPRYDLPMFGVYMPITYHFNSYPNLGLSVRGGPVWLGVSDFIGMMVPGGMKNFAIYGGFKIPIYHKKVKDRDKDFVSDKYDLCPKVKGNWLTNGCADKDNDGVRDEKDECPEMAGLVELKGCPDADKDGIIDSKDLCPFDAGIPFFMGCPDTDNDSVPDKDDLCPDVKGTRAMKGCPDSDGDGVADPDDKCKGKKGSPDHAGCPDTDGDGVYDHEDDDPETAGPVENRGKPWEDSDDDGIFDNEDSCKLIPGIADYFGCPDPPRPNLIPEMSVSYGALYFGINQWEVSLSNEKLLRVFAQKMNTPEQKDNTIVIYGHTDNAETDPGSRNDLSLRRAKAVRDMLFYNLGISRSRIEIFPYGDEKPAEDNATAAGRSKNRRVELMIKIIGN